ncbi:MAG: 50S ribosomal protein L18 [Candidatus Melainabacteria bacterium]|nr:50S ribosomal protein L18 [Candidatus Melainabacteria bacterium]
MINKVGKKEKARKRHKRIRKNLAGTSDKPRLAVFKSNKHIYAQIIDDIKSCTLASCSSLEPSIRNENKDAASMELAKKIGVIVAQRALEKGIKQVVFDRGGFQYHGKISALASAARETGIKF